MKDNILSQKSELTDFLSEMLRSLSQFFRMTSQKTSEGIALEGKGFCVLFFSKINLQGYTSSQ
jgi:hypothetical protein